MQKQKLEEYREILETKLAELSMSLRNRNSIAVEVDPDEVDNSVQALHREAETRKLDSTSRLIQDVRRALQRIQEGEFGICKTCEEAITEIRLAAVPWTANCVKCQQKRESGIPLPQGSIGYRREDARLRPTSNNDLPSCFDTFEANSKHRGAYPVEGYYKANGIKKPTA